MSSRWRLTDQLLLKVKQLSGPKSQWDGEKVAAEAQAKWALQCMYGFCTTVCMETEQIL